MGHCVCVFGCLALLVGYSGSAAGEEPSLLLTDLRLNLTVNYDDGTIGGTAVLTFKNSGTAPASRVPIQLGRLMHVSAIQEGTGKELAFTQDIVTYDDWPELQVAQIYTDLPTPLSVGDSQSLAIYYAGTLVGYTETGMRYVRDHVDSAFTIIRTDAHAIPIVTEPSLASLRAQPRGDFTFGARITVPAGLTVATGTPERERMVSGNQITWVFEGPSPIPFLNISIAPYGVVESGGVRVFHFREDSAGARVVVNAIDRATNLLSRWFGPLPDSLRLHVIEIPDGWGSQASLTGGIIQSASAFRDADRLRELYHELSHLWNVSDLDHPSCRWNEGFAMFLQERIDAELRSSETLESRMAKTLESCRKRIANTPDLAQVAFIDYGQNGMTDYSYSTGELMFYLLFRVMGAERFDRAVSGFLQAFGPTGSSAAEFAGYLRKDQSEAVDQVLTEWLETTQWTHRLGSGESLSQLVSEYLR